jgi:hypothetical protein
VSPRREVSLDRAERVFLYHSCQECLGASTATSGSGGFRLECRPPGQSAGSPCRR